MEGKEWLNKIHQGNVLEVLRQMPDEFVDCIVTSPPYWGLRDYGEETYTIWGGDPNCEHQWEVQVAKHDNLRPCFLCKMWSVVWTIGIRTYTGFVYGTLIDDNI